MTTNLNDVLRVTAIMSEDTSGTIANVYHFQLTTLVSSPLTDAQTMADVAAKLNAMYTTIYLKMKNTVDFDTINVFNVTQDRPLGNIAWPSLVNGNEAGNFLPSQTAAFLQGNTGFSRSWARKFLGGFTETHNESDGTITSSLLSDLANFATAWLAAYVSASGDTYTSVLDSTKFGAYLPIIEVVLNAIWATIRRRRIGKGA